MSFSVPHVKRYETEGTKTIRGMSDALQMFSENLQFDSGSEITAISARPLTQRAPDIRIRIEHIVIISIAISTSHLAFTGLKNVSPFKS